jgi:hypothetical protein
VQGVDRLDGEAERGARGEAELRGRDRVGGGRRRRRGRGSGEGRGLRARRRRRLRLARSIDGALCFQRAIARSVVAAPLPSPSYFFRAFEISRMLGFDGTDV